METLFSFRYMRILVAVLLGMVILAVAAIAAQAFNLIKEDPYHATINVEGVSKVMVVPDIGVFTFSVETENMEVAKAQEESGEKINAIMAFLKSEGNVEEKDIKTTGYNTYPRYEYETARLCIQGDCNRERVLKGYVVSQSVEVRVRDTKKAGELIAGVGNLGATNLSGLSFTIDDLEGKKEEARLLAVEDAREKAKRLAKELDVRLGDIVSFNDNDGDYPRPMYNERQALMMDSAVGGAVEEISYAPEISVGENEIVARVTITYKLK